MAHPYHHALSSAKKWEAVQRSTSSCINISTSQRPPKRIFVIAPHYITHWVYICSNSILDPSSQSPQAAPFLFDSSGTTCDTRSGPDSNTFRLDPLHPPGTWMGRTLPVHLEVDPFAHAPASEGS